MTDNNEPVATKLYADNLAIAGAPAWSETVSGIGQLATTAEAIAGTDDVVFTEEQLRGWKQHTNSTFKFRTVNGGHLFCRDNKEELLEILTTELSDSVMA